MLFLKVAAIVLAFAPQTTAHIFFTCPSARSCFYGGSGLDTDKEGSWKREPCDRVAIAPTTVVGSGEDLCLEIQEFVPHPGFYTIKIFDGAVNPGDAEPDWIVLGANIPQGTDGLTTGFQGFVVTIPEDLTCAHCTIQVQLVASDGDVPDYYTACSDIEVVSNTSTAISTDACWDLPEAQCTFRDGPSRVRVKKLQQLMLINFFFVLGIAIAVYCVRVHRGSKRVRADGAGSPKSGAGATCWGGFKEEARMPRHMTYLKWLTGATIVVSIALAVTFVGLKNCWVE